MYVCVCGHYKTKHDDWGCIVCGPYCKEYVSMFREG
jgi:hypothetical protein